MQVFVGTSGWSYLWNEGGNLEWFIQNSGLNSVELNASFYRFPFKNQVAGWAKRGKELRWVVKVHRLITHQHKLNEEALPIWERFGELFLPLDPLIDFYLFQLPPGFGDLKRVAEFFSRTGLGSRFALEIRNKDLLADPELPLKIPQEMTLVSQDSPDFKEKLFPGKTIYLRMHGRKSWYSYDYSLEELESLSLKIKGFSPEKVFIMFNNDQAMLKNARMMYEVLSLG
ncbi:MAG: DUF72 domain-containing protein [Caldiserica bacterium]|nr:DUF72 domain-containing protein [Caldisericota bacterium]MDH7561999.1 DUF72 domain-containing protein [Caldisericota bacterium]